jgi:hypothetical protein
MDLWNLPTTQAKPIDPRTGAEVSLLAIPKRILTPPFLLSWPYLFKPQAAMEGNDGPPKYGITMVFKKGNTKQDLGFMAACARIVAKKKWGSDGFNVMAKKLRSPFRDSDEEGKGEKYKEMAGTIYVAAKSAELPGVLGLDGQAIVAGDAERMALVYSGCLARATLSCYAYEKSGNKGVAFGLLNLQVLAHGKRLGGGMPAGEDFKAAPEVADLGGLVEAPDDEPPF